MDFYFINLAWKNLWRNPRRAVLTLNAIALSVMVLTYVYNYYDAFHEQVIQNAIRYHSGHLSVSAKDYIKNRSTLLYIRDSKSLMKFLAKEKNVRAFSPRVTLQGMISSSYSSANVLFHGIEPKREAATTQFANNIVKGDFFKSKRKSPIVVGAGLAELLKLKIGSKVVVLTQGVDGSVGNQLFYVNGIFDTQSEVDKNLVFVNIDDARALTSLPPTAVHHVSVLLTADNLIKNEKSRIKKVFRKERWDVQSWEEVQRHVMAMIELNKSANRILLFIILAVASLGIANSILMGILERTREFGVMSAIGTARDEMIRMVILETILLAVAGTGMGAALGIGVTLYFGKVGFDLKWLTSQPLVINGAVIQTVSYPVVIWHNIAFVAGIVILLSLLASFIPVRHVSKLKTVEALRAV